MHVDSPTAALPPFAGDAVLIAGGARAILLQLAHPAVGRAVARHSDFEHRPLDRLWSTLGYAYAIVFGSEHDKAIAVRAVNRAHAPVRNNAHEGAPAYNAYDPALQLWVAATLYDTAITVSERFFGPLDEPSADALYSAYAALGTRLQVPAGMWPIDRAAFQQYWDGMLPTLQTDAATRAVARKLLYPTAIPAYLRPAAPVNRLVTAGLLPDSVRPLYGARWDAAAERRLHRLVRVTAAVWPLLPGGVRQWPRDSSLRRLRRSATAPRAV